MNLMKTFLPIKLPKDADVVHMMSLKGGKRYPDVDDASLNEVVEEDSIGGTDAREVANYTNGDEILVSLDQTGTTCSFYPQVYTKGTLIGTDENTGELIVEINGVRQMVEVSRAIAISTVKRLAAGRRGNAIVSVCNDTLDMETIYQLAGCILLLIAGTCAASGMYLAAIIAGIGYVSNEKARRYCEEDISLYGKKFTSYISFRAAAIKENIIPQIGDDKETKDTIIDVYVGAWTRMGRAEYNTEEETK